MQSDQRPMFDRPPATDSRVEDFDAEFNAATGARAGGGMINKLILLSLLAISGFLLWRNYGPKPALAGWSSDWDSATAQAQQGGKPTLVLFTADWCPPCKQFKAELARDDVAPFLQRSYSLVIVDLTDRAGPNNNRAAQYGVRSIPTLVLYDASGAEQGRTNGMSGDDLLTWLRRGGKF